MGSLSCAPLPGEVSLQYEEEITEFLSHHSVIEQSPLSPFPLSLNDIPKEKSSYLIPMENNRYCVYPLTSSRGASFEPSKIFKSHFASSPPRFGIPTRLQSYNDRLSPAGVVRAPTKTGEGNLFYAPDAYGLNWFLVGDGANLQSYLDSISQWRDRFDFTREMNPQSLSFSNNSYKFFLIQNQFTLPTPASDEAYGEIEEFLMWLETADPELYREAAPRIEYVGTFDPEGIGFSWKKYERFKTYYAEYDPSEKSIILFPTTIHLLKHGKYREVAVILAHEMAHHLSSESAVVSPSVQTLVKGLDLFLTKRWEDPRIHPGWLTGVVANEFFEEAPIPEEEIQACAHELRYGKIRFGEDLDPAATQEGREMILDMEAMLLNYPQGLRPLAEQYLANLTGTNVE